MEKPGETLWVWKGPSVDHVEMSVPFINRHHKSIEREAASLSACPKRSELRIAMLISLKFPIIGKSIQNKVRKSCQDEM
jgi:hypothetical protein